MSRLPGIAFLAVFAYALSGVYPVQWALRELAREDMKAFIQAGGASEGVVAEISFALVQGEVADPRFTWQEQDEFSFCGAMYDVVGREVKNSTIIFHCISDQRETEVVSGSTAIAQASDNDRSIQGHGHAMIKSISERYVKDELLNVRVIPVASVFAWRVRCENPDPGFASSFTPPPRG